MKTTRSQMINSRGSTLKLIVMGLPLLLGVLLLAGCKHSDRAASDTNPTGTYTLVSVDGNKVPCAIQHDGHPLKVESGTFTIGADGTCQSNIRFSVPTGNPVDRQVKATYTKEGSKLTMKWEGAGMTTGKVEGNSFTMNNEGNVFAYKK